MQIEFNPHRPHGRTRFSIAHEIVHTLFPDCGESVRNREQPGSLRRDEWQLELLCNIGAAEILMPSGYKSLGREPVDMNNLLRLRREFDVSTEALLIRIAKLTGISCAMFAAAREDDANPMSEYRIDYSIPSRSWPYGNISNLKVQEDSVLAECVAVGFTANGTETWGDELPEFRVESVGIPPFPGRRYPRVAGVLLSEQDPPSDALQIEHLFGDATEPRGTGPRVIAHIVNDATPRWGGRGFAREVRRRWSTVQDDFEEWVSQDRSNLTLGKVHQTQINHELSIVHMVAQHGYGPSTSSRLRYFALDTALDRLADIALAKHASVHMPRIGTGEARGSWELIQELIDERLVRRGIPVSVYTLPDSVPIELQGSFGL